MILIYKYGNSGILTSLLAKKHATYNLGRGADV
jgi:hypothetical protein